MIAESYREPDEDLYRELPDNGMGGGAAVATDPAHRRDTVSADEIERLLRKEWWINHGHDYYALYGDDGEMACNACPADFKRWPIEKLQEIVMAGRAARAAAAFSSEAGSNRGD